MAGSTATVHDKSLENDSSTFLRGENHGVQTTRGVIPQCGFGDEDNTWHRSYFRSSLTEDEMRRYFWNDGSFGWNWFLWLGIIFLLFSRMGNWRPD